jgi:hypothetical protein
MQGTHSTYKKLAVQWLNETLCFVSTFVVADSLVLRNRQLLVAAKRCATLSSDRKLEKIIEILLRNTINWYICKNLKLWHEIHQF